jgi:peptide/nickel transport system permease protein
MGGLVVTEQVFNLNGLGKLFVESVTNHDYTMTQGLVMLVVFIFVLTNFMVKCDGYPLADRTTPR